MEKCTGKQQTKEVYRKLRGEYLLKTTPSIHVRFSLLNYHLSKDTLPTKLDIYSIVLEPQEFNHFR